MPDPIAQPTMTAGAASYPPAYDKPGPTLDRGYRNYIRARMNRDATGADVARSWVEALHLRRRAGCVMRYYILNGAGDVESVLSMRVWGEWFAQNPDACVVDRTRVGDAEVSTVFLGIDHSSSGKVPILFETMIFEGPHDNWTHRYATKADAVLGHQRAVEALRNGHDPDENAGSAS